MFAISDRSIESTMRVAIYARVSTKDQSCALQIRDLKTYCAARKLTVFREYIDVGESGAKNSRPQLNDLMADARKRRFDAILVWRFDRFARSTKHLLLALEEFRSLGIQFISYQENIDTTSPLGQALFTIVSAVAQLERDLIRERVSAGIRHARACGKQLGRPRRIVDQDELIRLKAEGASLREIAKKLRVGYGTVRLPVAQLRNFKSKEETMLIRNNRGEIVGEMNTTITQEGTVITHEHALQQWTSCRAERIRPRQSGESPHNECDRWKDYALVEIHRTGSQKKHNRRKAIWDMNVDPTRHGARHGG